MTSADREFRLGDGRRISYREFGARDGWPVLALHGTPGSRLKFAQADGSATAFGLRLVSPDRWGYGATSPHPAPTLARFGSDMAELADGLGLSSLAVLGISGGGPFAAAVAARLEARVPALALVSPVGPMAGEGADGGLDLVHHVCFRGMPRVPGATRLAFTLFRGLLEHAPRSALRLASARAGRADRALMCDPETCHGLAQAFRAGLAHGVDGPIVDMELFGRPWELALGDIRAATRLWLGSEDRNVPHGAARALARAIRGCELTQLEGEGHFWICRRHGDVLGWLATAAERARSP